MRQNLQSGDRLRPIDLARAHGLSTQAVRNYEAAGILPGAERSPHGYRAYTPLHAQALTAFLALLPGYGHRTSALIMQAVNQGAAEEVTGSVAAAAVQGGYAPDVASEHPYAAVGDIQTGSPGATDPSGAAGSSLDGPSTPETVDGDVSRETAGDDEFTASQVARPAASNDADQVSRETADLDRTVAAQGAAVVVARGHDQAEVAADDPFAVPPRGWPLPDAVRVITVANQKGGVGKTTSTVNLAAALSQHGARVLVVDLDPQGNASTAFNVDHREGVGSIYEVLVDGRDISEVTRGVADFPGLRCVPATIDVAGAEVELVSVVARETRLRKAIAPIAHEYDYVFIDCPPSLGLLTLNALVACREVLIPIQCEFYALEGLTQLLRNIELVRGHLNDSLEVSTILLTMYDARTRLSDQVGQDVRRHFGELVIEVAIPRSVRISEAPGFGQTVLAYDPSSRGARAYLRAAYEIAKRNVSRPEVPDLTQVEIGTQGETR